VPSATVRDEEAPSDDRRATGFGWFHVILGVAGALAAVVLCDWIEPRPGEAVWLRWLRVFADHPLRGAAAIALLAFALRRRSPAETRSLGTEPATLYHARHIGRPEGR